MAQIVAQNRNIQPLLDLKFLQNHPGMIKIIQSMNCYPLIFLGNIHMSITMITLPLSKENSLTSSRMCKLCVKILKSISGQNRLKGKILNIYI